MLHKIIKKRSCCHLSISVYSVQRNIIPLNGILLGGTPLAQSEDIAKVLQTPLRLNAKAGDKIYIITDTAMEEVVWKLSLIHI